MTLGATSDSGFRSQPLEVQVDGLTLSGRIARPAGDASRGLILALHGGSFTSAYFDSPRQSQMQIAAQLGYSIIALDRPGYGMATTAASGLHSQAQVLVRAVSTLSHRYVLPGAGIFLYGHSIGGMIALLMTNIEEDVPFVGINMTGSGALPQRGQEAKAAVASMPSTHLEIPPDLRRNIMMGPDWTFDAEIGAFSADRDVPLPLAENKEVPGWAERLPAVARLCTVAVQFIVAEYDSLWRADEESLNVAHNLFPAAPFIEVGRQRMAGHCVELHRLGIGHLLRVLAFAEECFLTHEHEAAST